MQGRWDRAVDVDAVNRQRGAVSLRSSSDVAMASTLPPKMPCARRQLDATSRARRSATRGLLRAASTTPTPISYRRFVVWSERPAVCDAGHQGGALVHRSLAAPTRRTSHRGRHCHLQLHDERVIYRRRLGRRLLPVTSLPTYHVPVPHRDQQRVRGVIARPPTFSSHRSPTAAPRSMREWCVRRHPYCCARLRRVRRDALAHTYVPCLPTAPRLLETCTRSVRERRARAVPVPSTSASSHAMNSDTRSGSITN